MPEGQNDRGDHNATAAGAIDFDNGRPKRVTTRDVPGCQGDFGKERVRVDALLTGADGQPATITTEPQVPYPVVIANNATITDGAASDMLAFNIYTGVGTLGATALTGLPRSSKIGVHGYIDAAVFTRGNVVIEYRVAAGAAWQLYEAVPLSGYYPVDKIIALTQQEYRIYYRDIADTLGTTNLYLTVIIYPTPT